MIIKWDSDKHAHPETGFLGVVSLRVPDEKVLENIEALHLLGAEPWVEQD